MPKEKQWLPPSPILGAVHMIGDILGPVIPIPSTLTLQKDADADVDITFTLSLPAGKEVTIAWGDGNISTVTGPQTETDYSNSYGDANAYTIVFSGDITFITYFNGSSQPISGDIADLSGLTSLTVLYLYSTSVSGDIADLSGLTSLTALYLYSTSIDTYTQGTLPDWDACEIQIQALGLSEAEVDDFLCDLNAASSASTKTLNISGSNSAPSATGLACETSLEGKGWTVTVTGE